MEDDFFSSFLFRFLCLTLLFHILSLFCLFSRCRRRFLAVKLDALGVFFCFNWIFSFFFSFLKIFKIMLSFFLLPFLYSEKRNTFDERSQGGHTLLCLVIIFIAIGLLMRYWEASFFISYSYLFIYNEKETKTKKK
jgi:hypothetical protein